MTYRMVSPILAAALLAIAATAPVLADSDKMMAPPAPMAKPDSTDPSAMMPKKDSDMAMPAMTPPPAMPADSKMDGKMDDKMSGKMDNMSDGKPDASKDGDNKPAMPQH